MKNLTKLQKKKIWYSFAATSLIGIVVAISVVLWGTDLGEALKAKIATSLISYASVGFLLFKVIYFFIYEIVKNKVVNKEKQIRDFIVDKTVETLETKELPMTKQKSVSNQPKTLFKSEIKIQEFTISINEDKGLFISFDKNNFASREDFYNKLKYAMGEAMESLRKEINNDK